MTDINPFPPFESTFFAFEIGQIEARRGEPLDPKRFKSVRVHWYEGELHDAYAMGHESISTP